MRSHFSFCLISTDLVYMYTIPFLTLGLEDAIGRKEELQNRTKFFSIFRILPEIFFNRKSSFSERMGVFCIFKCVFLKTTITTNYCHIEGSNSRNFASVAITFHRAIE